MVFIMSPVSVCLFLGTLAFSLTASTEIPYSKKRISLSAYSRKVISSYGFTSSSYYKKDDEGYTYEWKITSSSRSPYIRVIFTDYHLGPGSIIKIFDGRTGADTTPTFIFTSGKIPVFHSKSRYLSIVLKTGGRIKKPYYRGIRASLTSLSTPRQNWRVKTIPSTGYCGTLDIGYPAKNMVFQPPSNALDQYLFQCIWNIRANYLQIKNTILSINGTETSILPVLHISGKGYSTASPDYTLLTSSWFPRVSYTSSVFYSASRLFYVSLSLSMKTGDRLEIHFSNSSVDIGQSQLNRRSVGTCPFKEKVRDTCYGYWDTAFNRDESCFVLNHNRQCGSSEFCYHKSYDKCDELKDCPDGKDEKDCEDVHWFAANVLGGAILVVIGWLCGCRRRGYRSLAVDLRHLCCSTYCVDIYVGDVASCCNALTTLCRHHPADSSSADDRDAASDANNTLPSHYVTHMPVVSISAGVDARTHHARLIQAAALLNLASPGMVTHSDVATRWDAPPPSTNQGGSGSGGNVPLADLPPSDVLRASSPEAESWPGGLPTYDQVRRADLELCTLSSSATGSQVDLLPERSSSMGSVRGEPPPSYCEVVTSWSQSTGRMPPSYSCIQGTSSDV